MKKRKIIADIGLRELIQKRLDLFRKRAKDFSIWVNRRVSGHPHLWENDKEEITEMQRKAYEMGRKDALRKK